MKQVLKTFFIAFLIGLWTLTPQAGAETQIDQLKKTSQAFNQVAEKGIAAVVSISTVRTVRQASGYHPFYDLFGDDFFRHQFQIPEREFQQQGLGSGVIVSDKGYILTNNHVIDGADEVTVTLSDKREFKAEIVGTDPKTDIALLKIESKGLPVIALGNSDDLKVGDWAIAIGSPFGLPSTMTVGIISATGRSDLDIVDYENFIQTDAAINQGNSGGALLNIDGELIGINTAILSRGGTGFVGIGFAIPVNMAIKIKDDLLESGKVVRGWLGVSIQSISEELRTQLNLKSKEGALISDVLPGSPAEKAGLKRQDVVLEYDGKRISSFTDLRSQVAQTKVGKKIPLKLMRKGKPKTIRVTIGSIPEDATAGPLSGQKPLLGLRARSITDEEIKKFGLSQSSQGVIITEIDRGGPADRAGLRPGDQILEMGEVAIGSIDDFNQVIQRIRPKDRLLLLIRRGQFTHYVVLQVSP